MTENKLRIKKLFAQVIAVLMIPVLFLCCSGFTATADAQIFYSGKGSIAVTVTSDKNEAEFRSVVDEYFRQYKYIDQDELVVLKQIEKTDDGYVVYADFRRIDKVKCVGQFEIDSLSGYTADGSQTKWNLEYWAAQDYQITRRVYFDSLSRSVSLDSGAGRQYFCTPKTADGTDIDVEALCQYGENTADNIRILTFCMFLSDSVSSVHVTLPGKISHFAGDAVTLDGENSFTITPQKITAKVAVDGVTEKEPVSTAIGYVVYDRGMSPVLLTIIMIGVVAVLILIAVIVIALYRAGLKRIRRLEGNMTDDQNETGGADRRALETDGTAEASDEDNG